MRLSYSTNSLPSFKAKRQRFGFGSMIFMILFGAIFGGAGGFMYIDMQIDPQWSRVQGSVVDVSSSTSDGSTTYTPIIEYSVSDQKYRVSGNMATSSYPTIGSAREVAFNPDRPDQSKPVEGLGAKLFILLFVVIGVFIFMLGPILYFRSLRRSQRINSLTQSGHKLQGILVDVQSEGSNNSGYKIVVAATDNSGMAQHYVSDSIAGIGSLAMADYKTSPIPIDVYVDPSNSQNYYVDISDIPNLTPQRISELIQSALVGRQTPDQTSSVVSPDSQLAPPLSTPLAPPVTIPAAQPVPVIQPGVVPPAPYEVNR